MSKKNNEPGKYIAIGDIHGCCRSIKELLKKLEPYKDHQLVFVGDYIDRGPCSRQVVSLMIELQEKRDCIFLRGNHEEMLLKAVENGHRKLWIHNGGQSTLRSYGLSDQDLDLPEDHMEFYRNTVLYYDTPDYFFVHAGAPPFQSIEKSIDDPEAVRYFLWTREHINAIETAWEKTVVFGHTPRSNPIKRPKMIGIDTGCVYSSIGYGKLTALVLPEEKFIQQYSLDND